MSVYFNPKNDAQIVCDEKPEGWLTAEEHYEQKWGKAPVAKGKPTPYPSVTYEWDVEEGIV